MKKLVHGVDGIKLVSKLPVHLTSSVFFSGLNRSIEHADVKAILKMPSSYCPRLSIKYSREKRKGEGAERCFYNKEKETEGCFVGCGQVIAVYIHKGHRRGVQENDCILQLMLRRRGGEGGLNYAKHNISKNVCAKKALASMAPPSLLLIAQLYFIHIPHCGFLMTNDKCQMTNTKIKMSKQSQLSRAFNYFQTSSRASCVINLILQEAESPLQDLSRQPD